MCKILIEREGGNIVRVIADRKIQIVIVDRDDNYKDDPVFIFPNPEIHNGNFSTMYDNLDEQDQEIMEHLLNLGV